MVINLFGGTIHHVRTGVNKEYGYVLNSYPNIRVRPSISVVQSAEMLDAEGHLYTNSTIGKGGERFKSCYITSVLSGRQSAVVYVQYGTMGAGGSWTDTNWTTVGLKNPGAFRYRFDAPALGYVPGMEGRYYCNATFRIRFRGITDDETIYSDYIYLVADYEGNLYNITRIGDLWWTVENLRSAYYSDGSELIYANGRGESTNSRYYYVNESVHADYPLFGYYYNQFGALNGNAPRPSEKESDIQGIAPSYWHVPRNSEFEDNMLRKSLSLDRICRVCGGEGGYSWTKTSYEAAAGNYDETDRNATGFSLLPCGVYMPIEEEVINMYDVGTYMSSSGSGAMTWTHEIYYEDIYAERMEVYGKYGRPVRCVCDIKLT